MESNPLHTSVQVEACCRFINADKNKVSDRKKEEVCIGLLQMQY